MKRLVFLFAVIALANTSTSAELFATALSDANAHEIKRLAVISVLGDTIHGRQIDPTVPRNIGFDATVPNWGLDAQVMNTMQKIVVESRKISGEVVPFAMSSTDIGSIIASARAQSFDAVITVLPEADSRSDYFAQGATLTHRKLPNFDMSWACNGMALNIYRIADGKQIGHAYTSRCSDKAIAAIWHDSWADFSEEEKKATLDAIQSYIKLQIGEALSTVNLCTLPVGNEQSESEPRCLRPHTSPRMDSQNPLKIGAPFYPPDSLRAKEQGRCVVSVTVTTDGGLKDASIQQSSGYPRLDQACLDGVAGGHLIPATENGIPIDKTIALPMVWSLTR